MKLWDLLDEKLLVEMVSGGYVRYKEHPTKPLGIYNYAEKAVYERVWNDVTLQCRGLIVGSFGEIVARPWKKFFNSGEHSDLDGLKHGKVEVTDKMDGSLGILYWDGTTWAIATRGSFQSDQAIHATEVLHAKYPYFDPDPTYTYLYEIIYPENRIVLNYKDQDDLVLLGGVEINTGYYVGPKSASLPNWSGPRTEVIQCTGLDAALSRPPRANAEGIVVRFLDTDLQIKIKQEDYCRAHAIVTGCSNRSIWETLSKGESLPEKASFMPDEFHAWMTQTAEDLRLDFETWLDFAEGSFQYIMLTPPATRKEFAEKAAQNKFRAALFKLYDGQSIDDLAWKAVRPETIVRPFTRSEEVA